MVFDVPKKKFIINKPLASGIRMVDRVVDLYLIEQYKSEMDSFGCTLCENSVRNICNFLLNKGICLNKRIFRQRETNPFLFCYISEFICQWQNIFESRRALILCYFIDFMWVYWKTGFNTTIVMLNICFVEYSSFSRIKKYSGDETAGFMGSVLRSVFSSQSGTVWVDDFTKH